MEINRAKMVGYRVIGIKDADKEKLANHVTSSFSVEQEAKPVPETVMSAPEVVSEPVQAVETVETPVAEPAPVETTAVEPTPAVEETAQTSVPEENIFDRMAMESVAEPSAPTPVVEPTPVVTPTASVQGGNVFDNPAIVKPVMPEVPEVVQNEESFDTPAVNLTSPAEFYGNINNEVKEDVAAPVNVENNVVEEKKISSNLGADALTALKALIEENESLKVKVADLTEKLNIAEARTKAAETTLNAAIQRDAKTLN